MVQVERTKNPVRGTLIRYFFTEGACSQTAILLESQSSTTSSLKDLTMSNANYKVWREFRSHLSNSSASSRRDPPIRAAVPSTFRAQILHYRHHRPTKKCARSLLCVERAPLVMGAISASRAFAILSVAGVDFSLLALMLEISHLYLILLV
jgi:hypothetical protein